MTSKDCKFKNSTIKPNQYFKLTKQLKSLLNKIAKKGCDNVVFTRFPFYLTNLDSKQLALDNKEGNCVSFSYYVHNLLKKEGIKSHIVGGHPPTMFFRDGYNEISHCAVVVPFNNGFIIFDTSFYFNKGIIVNKKKDENVPYTFKNVYSEESQRWDFVLKNDKIHMYLDGHESGGYYLLKELSNPHESITIHTNQNDQRIFRCEIDKRKYISKFYYKVDLYDHTLSVSINNRHVCKDDLSIFYIRNVFSNVLFENWIISKKQYLTNKQYKSILYDVSSLLKILKLQIDNID